MEVPMTSDFVPLTNDICNHSRTVFKDLGGDKEESFDVVSFERLVDKWEAHVYTVVGIDAPTKIAFYVESVGIKLLSQALSLRVRRANPIQNI